MRKSKVLAAVLAASLVFSSTATFADGPPPPGQKFGVGATGWVWGVFGCSSGIILAAMVANWQQNRQLTWNEAVTCGLLFWFTPPKKKP